MKIKKILVTGGAGFIGSNIASHYLENGIITIIVDNLSRKGTERNLKWLKKNHPSVKFINSDIRDISALKKAIKDVDVVFHMAGQVAVTKSIKNPREDYEVNLTGTINCLEAARNQKKPPIMIYASTNKVYGGMENTKIIETKTKYDYKDYKNGIDESFQLDFHSPYGCSKGGGDQYCLDYARIYGLKTIVFRQSCIYGNRQFGNEDQGWVAHFAKLALADKNISIYGNGKQVRDLLYIDDLINCYEHAIENIQVTSGNAYNIGGGSKNAVSLLELIQLLENNLQTKIKISYSKWRPGDQRVYISDIRKARKHFNWKPQTSIKQGIEKLLSWLKKVDD